MVKYAEGAGTNFASSGAISIVFVLENEMSNFADGGLRYSIVWKLPRKIFIERDKTTVQCEMESQRKFYCNPIIGSA